MSQEASGQLVGDGNGNFQASFIIDPNKPTKTFTGRLSQAVPKFKATVTVLFQSESDLSGKYDLDENATVGRVLVNWPTSNSSTGKKISITGNLVPYLSEAYSASGQGNWSST
jgi:hypothetical protein